MINECFMSGRGAKQRVGQAYSCRDSIGPLLFLAGIFYLNFLGRIILSPLLPSVEACLKLTHGQVGSLFIFLSMGYFIAILGSGFLSSAITHRRTVLVSAVATGVALVFTASQHGVWGLRTGVFMLGLSAGIYLPSGIATITGLFENRHWGRALSVHELAPNLAFLSAPFMAAGLLSRFTWNMILILIGIFSISAGLLYSCFGKGGREAGAPPVFSRCRPLFQLPDFWIMILLFSMGISSTLGIYNLLPLYLVNEYGMTGSEANSLVGLSRISTLFTALAGGWIADFLGVRITMGITLFLSGAVTVLLGGAGQAWIEACVFLQPVLAVCFFPAGFAALSRLGPRESRNIVVSLTVPVAFLLGGGIIPAVIGYMAESGHFGGGFVLAGCLMLTGPVLTWCLRRRSGEN